MPNRVLNSVHILYTPNIEDVQNYKNYASPNVFVISSYMNPGTYLGFEYYKGLSYELYYIDNNRNIQQLTYNIVKGNGLFVKDNKFDIKIDNNTLKTCGYKGKYYINVNTSSFKEASYLNRGLLSIKHDVYYNNQYNDTINENGAISLDQNNRIILSNGLKQDLQNISKYYNKCNNIINTINELYQICIKDLDVSTIVNVGDILYYNIEKKIYTLKKTNKSGTENTPAMVCVIASNILEDGEPRFMPLKRKMSQYIYDSSNIMSVKNTFNQIPIYDNNDVNKINISTNIKSSHEGYIAIKRNDWRKNIKNPFDSNENYYVLNDKILTYSISEEISKQHLNWYIDATKINPNNNYIILPNGIYTDIINSSIQNAIGTSTIYVIATIKFNNNITKYYLCNLKLSNNRFVNTSPIYGYNLMKTITNNFTEASYNASEQFAILSKKDIVESSGTINELPKSGISFTSLKTISPDFSEYSTKTNETFVISKDSNILTDTKVSIYSHHHESNKFGFTVQASVKGQILLTTTVGIVSPSQIIVNDTNTLYSGELINNSYDVIYPVITANFTPNEVNKYKTSMAKLQTAVAGLENPKVNNDTNTNTNNTNNTNNNSNSNKQPSGGAIIYNNGNIVEWSTYHDSDS